MKIVVASGKGGTGKTTIATSLALIVVEQPVRFLDCDVEAPNAALFLQPMLETRKEVGTLIPEVDERSCTYCGKCSDVCQYHAIAVVANKILVFPELCHGCGSCTLICPENAIREQLNVTGLLEMGPALNGIEFSQGVMHVGQAMAVPIIRELKKWVPGDPEAIEIRDAPPGASCQVVETIRGTDFVLLVTEPTPFGLHDLKQVAEIAQELEIPAGVIINRDGIGDHGVEEYCLEANLPILMRVPMERGIAEGIALGKTLIDIRPEFRAPLGEMLNKIVQCVPSKAYS